MKITKLELQGFRAFDEPFILNLNDGKNLLLFGQNGSGKSSIYLALQRFFEEQGDIVTAHRNHFSPDNRPSIVTLELRDSDGDVTRFTWKEANGHPLRIPADAVAAVVTPDQRSTLVDAARRSGFLDYRAMLRTHLPASPLSRKHDGPAVHDIIYGTADAGFEEQLFDVVSLSILSGVRTTIAGGIEVTFGELIRNVWKHRPQNRRPEQLATAASHCNTFNQAFNARLPELQQRLKDFLTHFENHQLEISFPPVSLAWDKDSLSLQGATLIPEVKFRGKLIAEYRSILNEARLSALAVCIFLAGVSLSDNDVANPNHPRFLLLDDVLIGLELQNRLPVLEILCSGTFQHYQIFLLTHDRVWYDLAKNHLRVGDRWVHKELFAEEANGHLIPRIRPGQNDVARAQEHLNNHDLRAAAVYARAAFETRLQNVCEDKGVRVPYKKDLKDIKADNLWQAIVQRQRDREKQRQEGNPNVQDFIPPQLEIDVQTMRSTVLNQLAHANPPALTTADVSAAIQTILRLQQHPF